MDAAHSGLHGVCIGKGILKKTLCLNYLHFTIVSLPIHPFCESRVMQKAKVTNSQCDISINYLCFFTVYSLL